MNVGWLHQDLPGKISGIRGPVVAACCIQEKGDGIRVVLFTLCCSVLQCVAVCCCVLHSGKGDGTRAVLFTLCCSVLQCVAVCCSVLQCV